MFKEMIAQIKALPVDPSTMPEAQLKEIRTGINMIVESCGVKMSETSTKDRNYDDQLVSDYIDDILEDGFNLNATELSDSPEFVDAQRLRKWKDLIASRVEVSKFGAKNFKVHSLRLLRSNIAASRTLHELRRAVNLIISPLQLWRDHQETCERYSQKNISLADQEIDKFVDKILLENEALQKVCAERKRVIDELLVHYEEGLSDIVLLRNCENAKKLHNLSDNEVAKVFGINRKKLQRLRTEINTNNTKDIV